MDEVKKTKSVSVRVHIGLEEIKHLLDSASRGSEYWSSNRLGFESETQAAIHSEVNVYDIEAVPQKAYGLNLKKIKKGLTVMAKKEPVHFADFLTDDYDMITGDVFLQCCLFGEVIYG